MDFQPDFNTDQSTENALWILFRDGEKEIAVVSKGDSEGSENPLLETLPVTESEVIRQFYVGLQKGRAVFAAEASREASLPDGQEWKAFRDVYRSLKSDFQFSVSRSKQLLNWDRSHRFCGSCGSETERSGKEFSRICPDCSEHFYPRLSPAIIVRILRGDQIMMAHNVNFPEGLYSHIAGFVEAGESLEQAVRREVKEEVNLEVEDIQFFSSQPWPLPHSLMVAFTATCPEGDPQPDGVEITDARWFTKETLPLPPSSGSIAWAMLQDYLNN